MNKRPNQYEEQQGILEVFGPSEPLGQMDRHFKPRERMCGRCSKPFTTTPLRRYLCKGCWTSVSKHGFVSEYSIPD